ncbi:MAG: CHAT domain-containing protein [Cyanobacteriota bacterium]|nr:CHAT domain-containing protein [Cyanobacteriota bacterium]
MEKTKTYYTYCIRVTNRDRVLVERRDAQHKDLGRPNGAFRYQEKFQQMEPLLAIARDNSLNDAEKARALGEALFDLLFDDVLLHDFVEFYNKAVQQEKQLLRVELDIDEGEMPEVAALPWEFLRVPARANLGTIWMGTLPDVVFYRRRPQWNPPKPIQLERDEKLKIALVVSAPPDLKPVAYEGVEKALEELAKEQANRIELLPIVNSANPEEIDTILSQKPHIFHFIGHGRLRKEGHRDVGEIALVDLDLDEAMWVDADYFSGLFARHRPSVVMLQACEGGKMSEERAFTGVASGIIQQKIPVVVAMQYEVTNSTASRFSRRFYQRLAAGDPVDIAAQDGRYAIALGPTQYRKRDFATPVIFMGVEDGYLFRPQGEEVESGANGASRKSSQRTDPQKDTIIGNNNNVVKNVKGENIHIGDNFRTWI